MTIPRYALTASCLLLLLAVLGGGQAQGQINATPTGTPTVATAVPVPSPTVSIPTGKELLKLMNVALAAKNTFHLVGHLTENVPSIMRLVESTVEDASLKPRLDRSVTVYETTQLTVKPRQTKRLRLTTILVKKRTALKIGTSAWSCTSPTTSAPPIGLTMPAEVGPVKNLGLGTINSIPVWHVRAVAPLGAGNSPPVTVDYYIAQSDDTLVRETYSSSFGAPKGTSRVKLVIDVSKYGKAVMVTLPATCRG